MSTIPANYTVPRVVTNFTAVDSAENAQRLASVESLADVIMSDDPKVSVDQKLQAFSSLSGLGGKSWRDAGAREARSKLYWLKTESPLAKELDAVGNRYQAMGMAEGRAAQARGGDEEWTGGNPIAAFSKFSDDDQKRLMVALGLNDKYGSVQEAYDDYQRQSDEAVAKYQASKRDKAVEVSLSDDAKALLGPEAAAKAGGSAAEQALAMLKAGNSGTDDSSVALRMLEKAAEARAAAKADEADNAADPKADAPPSLNELLRDMQGRLSADYRSGDTVDKTA